MTYPAGSGIRSCTDDALLTLGALALTVAAEVWDPLMLMDLVAAGIGTAVV